MTSSVDFSPFLQKAQNDKFFVIPTCFCQTEQSERGNPQRKGNAKFIVFAKTARDD